MKKILVIMAIFTTALLAGCGENTITCGEGTIADGNTCILDDGTGSVTITIPSDVSLTFTVGDMLPDLTTYFVVNDVVIDGSMITHTLVLDSDNKITTAGSYTATVTVEGVSKTVTITVEEQTTGTVAVTLAANKTLSFYVGDTMPDLLSYFMVTGATPDVSMITHNIALTGNVMTSAGTYTIDIDVSGVTKSVTITVMVDTSNDTIQLVPNSNLSFNLGDTLPDFSTYFTVSGVTVDNSMIEHSILLDAANTMTTTGVFSVTITAGGTSKTVSITVSDPSATIDDFIVIGFADIYAVPDKQVVFNIGDTMPNFLTYFVAYDGVNYVEITPDLVLHDLLLNANNQMIQAGTYHVTVEMNVIGVVRTRSIELTVTPPGGASVESIGSTGWEIVNPNYTDADLFDSWMVPNGDVVITNENGAVEIQVNTVGMNFWDVLFAQPGKTFEKGYTYEVTYRLKTGLAAGRDVVLFVESSQGAPKLLQEQVSLSTTYQDFTFTFDTLSNTTTGMVGVFIGANLPGAHPGAIIFDSVVITRTGEPIADVNFEDLPNQDFTNSDIAGWGLEGQVTLSHDVAGYLVANVAGLTGNFWDDNIQFGGFLITAGTEYTVSYTIKTDVVTGRDVSFFIENTDAGYAKYFENVETLTTEFQTFTYTFTPDADNDDTKIGIFLGAMDNAFVGNVIVDSITITVE